MHNIIKFICKWIIPIGFVELICKRNDKLFNKDTIPGLSKNQTYWRITESKKQKGAGILIRRS